MNPFPSPLLCLYCDEEIRPNIFRGAKAHMYKCSKHPANKLIRAVELIETLVIDAQGLKSTTKFCEDRFKQLQEICEQALLHEE